MRKKMLLLILCLVVAHLLSACAGNRAAEVTEPAQTPQITIYTTLFSLQDFSRKIGGERVQVINLIPEGVEPHDWEPGPQAMVSLTQAELLIVNGLGMEPWLEKTLNSLDGNVTVINASENITPIYGYDGHSDEHKEEDDHKNEESAEGELPDPHVWLDPFLALAQAERIAAALTELDPEYGEYYSENLELFRQEVEALDKYFSNALQAVTRREFVVTHLSFGYLAKRYDLKQKAISGLTSYAEPSPAQMKALVDFVREHDIRYIFQEPLASARVAEALAAETGTQLLTLNPLEGLTSEERAAGDDYFSVMRRNLEQLVRALSD